MLFIHLLLIFLDHLTITLTIPSESGRVRVRVRVISRVKSSRNVVLGKETQDDRSAVTNAIGSHL